MSEIIVDIPKRRSIGYIPSEFVENYCDEDVYSAQLPNGMWIDVGWWPQNDPNGEFVISVYDEHWENEYGEAICVKTGLEVKTVIESLAAKILSKEHNDIPRSRY
jgi:hypothetical protein